MERLLAKMGVEMKKEMENNGETTDTNQEDMKAKIEVSSQKFEVLRENMWTNQEEMKIRTDALVSRIDTYQAKIEANHGELMAAKKNSQERMEALMDVKSRCDEGLPRAD
jgi:hypothetical protein